MFLTAAETPYDFRASDAYGNLSTGDRQRLEQVHRDLVLLWGALDMYADQHNGKVPSTLDELVPKYMADLPSDPFATPEIARAQTTGGYTPSKGGLGYRFMRGAPGDRTWLISSVGLPDLPYLAERGNVGLYLGKGTWISGINPTMTSGAIAVGLDRQAEDKAHCEWLAKIIREIKTIKVGMTRRDVEKVLVEDVGAFTDPKAMRYQHTACSYIKLDLQFELAASGDRKDDKITKCSDPLLDLVPNRARW